MFEIRFQIMMLLTFLILFSKIYMNGIDDSSSYFLEKNYKNFYDVNNEDFSSYKNIDLFLPVNDKNSKYHKINEINDTNFNFSNPKNEKDIYIINDELLQIYEDVYFKDKITNLILKSERNNNYKNNYENEEEFPEDYNFYEKKDNIAYDNYYTWQRLISKDIEIKEYINSKIEKIITTVPDEIIISSKICMPINITFEINNPQENENTLIIKSIKTDMYQIKIIPYDTYENDNYKKYKNYSFKTLPPCPIYSGSKFLFKLLILADFLGTTRGTLYIEFNNKNVLMIPITLYGIENKYKLHPFYFDNWKPGIIFSKPIKVYNPNDNISLIKNVIHSFKKINILWPNDVSVSNNSSSISPSNLQIFPNSTKSVIYIKFLSDKNVFEYGLLQLTINKNKFLIPILINIENNPISFYPSFINFGICDILPNSYFNIKKLIPIEITNNEKQPLKVSKVYINYEEKFLQFNYLFESDYIILQPEETVKFGYLIFNGKLDNYIQTFKDMYELDLLFKTTFGSIFIETNSTYKTMTEIKYSYYLDLNSIQSIERKNYKLNTNELISILVELNQPFGIELNRNYAPGDYIQFDLDEIVSAFYLNPYNMNESYSSEIYFNITELNDLNYNRYYFFPLQLNFRLYSLIPIKIDNDNIDFLYCGHKNYNSFYDCLYSNKGNFTKNLLNDNFIREQNLDLGIINYNQLKNLHFYLINENEEAIKINSIEIDNPLISINFEEEIFFESTHNKKENNNIWKKIKLSELLKKNKNKLNFIEKNSITIYGLSTVKFSLNLFSEILDEFKLTISFKFSDFKILNINIKGISLLGNLNLTPSIVRFEPSFPGLFLEDKIINIKSTYNRYLDVLNIESTNERIIPKLETSKIFPNEKRILMKIHFNPYLANLDEDFMMEMNPIENYLSYKELYLWKEKQKLWEELRTEINANVTINTECTKENIRIRATLAKPSLVKNDDINFGLVQIGKTNETLINITNPSDMVITFKVLLASEDFGDIHNNNMFNNNDKYQFNGVNKFLVMKCLFNSKPYENFYNKSNIIIIEEDIDVKSLIKGKVEKTELIKKIIDYGNKDIKKYISDSSKVICQYFVKSKKEIMLEENEENNFLISKLFSKNFTQKIPIIKEMTDRKLIYSKKKSYSQKKSIIQKISNKIFSIFSLFILPSEEELYELYIKNSKNNKQSFFIPSPFSKQTFTISPHQKFSIPIEYHPFNLTKSSATLFIKNNLTILYPIKLTGEGGTGQIHFMNYYQNSRNKKTRLINNSKLIIDIDKEVFEYDELEINENITRTITLANTGNLNMIINNISVGNLGCEAYGIKILQCEKYALEPGKNIDIDISIQPNFNFYSREKDIYFYTDYQVITLKIVVNVSKEIISFKNKLFIIPYKNHTSFIATFIILLIFKTVGISVKKEIENDKQTFGKIKYIIENENFFIENLYMKSYKKENKFLNEDLSIAQIENLNSKEDNELNNNYKRNKRRKSKIKNKVETDIDDKKDSVNERKESINSINTTDNEVNKRKQSNLSTTIEDKKSKNNIPLPKNSRNKRNKNKRGKKPIGMENDKDSNNENNNNINNEFINIKNNIPVINIKYDNNKYFKRQNSWKSENNIPLPYQKHNKYHYNKNNQSSNKINIPITNIINGKKINNLHDLLSSEQELEKEKISEIQSNNNNDFNKNDNNIGINNTLSNKSNSTSTIINPINTENQKEIVQFEGNNKFEIIEDDINPIFLSEKKKQREKININDIENNQIKPQILKQITDEEVKEEKNKNKQNLLNYLDISSDVNKEMKKVNKSPKKNIINNNKEEYYSDNEKLKIIYNNIITDSKMKVNHTYLSGNELTDEEFKESMTKPYFKNLLDNAFNYNNKVFFSDPFNHTNNKGKLGKLIEDNKKEEKKYGNEILEKNEEENKNCESNEEDDEDDDYKNNLIDMDFNFNLI